mmetsp:Transcript_76511/g.198895  ORF Transcript_76511/g.198895 Transcript_76511/m.198895 type:complete len:194 (-) Transcript_76511:1083-1664(-)
MTSTPPGRRALVSDSSPDAPTSAVGGARPGCGAASPIPGPLRQPLPPPPEANPLATRPAPVGMPPKGRRREAPARESPAQVVTADGAEVVPSDALISARVREEDDEDEREAPRPGAAFGPTAAGSGGERGPCPPTSPPMRAPAAQAGAATPCNGGCQLSGDGDGPATATVEEIRSARRSGGENMEEAVEEALR